MSQQKSRETQAEGWEPYNYTKRRHEVDCVQ